MKRIFIAIALLLLGCAQYSGPASGGTGGANATGLGPIVHIKSFAFNPQEITVKQGSTVTWVNDDNIPHSVVGPAFSSQLLQPGDSFNHTFTEAPGIYSYKCGVHPFMMGKVTVTS